MTGIDVDKLRKEFPGLEREVGGRPAVFADAPGGTQVPRSVIDAIAAYLSTSNANQHGLFETSRETDEVVAAARRAGADLLGCLPDEVAFGQNMTSLNFALSRSLGRDLQPGDEVIVTALDHDANVAPWLAIAGDAGASVRWVEITDDCRLDLDSLERALTDSTRIVAFTLASNAVGTVTDARAVADMAHGSGAIVVADSVHYAPHRAVDVGELGVDFLFCSAYKFFGPHLGLMYGRSELLEGLQPYKVRPAPEASPERWETGTQNHEALAGLIACVDYIAGISPQDGSRRASIVSSLEATRLHEEELSRAFLDRISGIDEVKLFGLARTEDVQGRTPTFALRIHGLTPSDAARALADRGVFAWDGNYYALAVMEALGLEDTGGALRIGFCHYHSLEEVDYVASCIEALAR